MFAALVNTPLPFRIRSYCLIDVNPHHSQFSTSREWRAGSIYAHRTSTFLSRAAASTGSLRGRSLPVLIASFRQLLLQQFVHLAWIRFAARRFHDLTHEKAQDLI